MRALGRIAGLAALLALVVVAASATIRIGGDALGGSLAAVRGVHRFAASAAALAVLLLAWRAMRLRSLVSAAGVALVLMLALSAVGWATGTRPPPLAALFNQLGGTALAALLSWIAAACTAPGKARAHLPLAVIALALASLQVAYAAAMSLYASSVSPALLTFHAVLGLAAALVTAALGVRLALGGRGALGTLTLVCAAGVPALGILATVAPPSSPALPIGHSAAAALVLSILAYARGGLRHSA